MLHFLPQKNFKQMKNIGLLLLIFFLHACQAESSYNSFEASGESKQADYYEEQEEPSSDGDFNLKERKVIKTVDIRFQVDDLEESTNNIEQVTKEYNGLISNMNQTNSSRSINNYLSIRIPSDKLDEFLARIEEESIYTNYTRISAQDVTEEYLDITTRLATKKDVRDRYIDILRNKAKTVKDVLEAEEKIRIIQEEIESIEGRLKYLDNKTSLSTINIEIYQTVAFVESPNVYKKPFLAKLKTGFINGWNLIQSMIIGLVTIWPIILIIMLLFIFRKRIKRALWK